MKNFLDSIYHSVLKDKRFFNSRFSAASAFPKKKFLKISNGDESLRISREIPLGTPKVDGHIKSLILTTEVMEVSEISSLF